MHPYATHELHLGQENVLVHHPREYLALVDVETYPAFVAKEVDHLDMMAHLSTQLRALTAVAWGAPNKPLQLRLLITEDDRVVERAYHANPCATAEGYVRTSGQLCLTSHKRLYDCAHHSTHDLLRDEELAPDARPHLLHVPPGVYSVRVFYHFPFPFGGDNSTQSHAEPKIHYNIILRHYPFPPARVAPVRLPGMIPWAGEEASAHVWGHRHAA